MNSTVAQTKTRTTKPPDFVRHAFLAILGLWLFMPFASYTRAAQDALPYITVGTLASSKPDQIYASRNGDLFDLTPGFRQTWCDLAPDGTNCDDLAVAFVSTPPTVALTYPLKWFDPALSALIMRMTAALMLCGGMWQLWKRLAHRTPIAGWMLVGTAFAATPMALSPIGLGQTSPILFFSVCLGVGATTARRRVTIALAWAVGALLKLFPGALVLFLFAKKCWRIVGIAAATTAILTAVTLATTPTSIWRNFVSRTLDLNDSAAANPYNGSLHALLDRAIPGTTTNDAASIAITAICVVFAGCVCWFGMRKASDDAQWALGYVALLCITPIVWWHYMWVVFGALGITIAEHPRVDNRLMAILPIAAAVSIIPSIPNSRGWSIPVVQALLLIAAAVVAAWIARDGASRRTISGRSTGTEHVKTA